MNSKVWGQYLWRLLHTITYSYPNKCSQKLKGKYIEIFYCLRNIIPCSICKTHYRKRLNEFPVERFLNNKDNFINWLIKLHNEVNVGLHKRTVSRKEADSIYLDDKNKLKYDFKDFVILFRLFSMIPEHNFIEIQKFIKLVFEIYPNDFLIKNAKTSFKNIKKIHISSDLSNVLVLKLGQGIPYRSLTWPRKRNWNIGPMFFCNNNLPVRNQEQILRDSAYPKVNEEASNFWGLIPPH